MASKFAVGDEVRNVAANIVGVVVDIDGDTVSIVTTVGIILVQGTLCHLSDWHTVRKLTVGIRPILRGFKSVRMQPSGT